jgi:hypothetical protein
VEEVANDGDSWGKTTARSSGLPRRKESGNGAVEWQLAGCKWVAVTHLDIGEKLVKGKEASVISSFYRWKAWRRDRASASRRQAGPLKPWHTPVSPIVVGVARRAVGLKLTWATVTMGRTQTPLNKGFSFIQTCLDFKLLNRDFFSSKLLQTFYECILAPCEKLSFWKQV